jgi:glycerophosphoryl diester phosphodiesterase
VAHANSDDRVTTWDIDPGSLRLPLIIAHRGDVREAPENTLPAFLRALAAGADGIELDVRLTRDNQLVVFHDRYLDRTSNGRGPLNHRTFAEIRALDVGSWFSPAFEGETAPTLDEVFETLPRDYLLNVEMKVVIKGMRLITHRVAETVRRHRRWGSTLVASFNPVALYHVRRLEPRIARGYIWSKTHPYPIRQRWFNPLVQAHWYDPANDTCNLKALRNLQRRGSRVLAWDLDFGGDLEMMASVHLDAVVTDDLAEMVGRKRELAGRLA